jgi:glycosyltransferase involved in cell wall biosynthesis
MRICFILEHYYPYIGGAEKLFRSLAGRLVSEGHDVRVITTRYVRSLPRHETIDGVEVKRVGSFGRYLFTLFSFPAVMAAVKQCDVVHTTSYNAALPAFIAARLRCRPVVITVHEVWGRMWYDVPFMSGWSRWLHRVYERFIVRLKFTRVIAVSNWTRKALMDNGVPPERIRMIYNGLDYTAYRGRQHDPPAGFKCVYFGRLGVSKGLDILLEGWKLFCPHHPDARLLLIMPRRPKKLFRKLQRLIRALQIGDTIDMLHELDEDQLVRTIMQCSCAVVPSLSEGFGYSAAEASALGLPVITSGRGALGETVSGNCIVINELSPLGMSKALEAAFGGRWEIHPFAEFPLSRTINEHARLYKELVGPEQKAPQ